MKRLIYYLLLCLPVAACDSFLDEVPTAKLTFDNFYREEKDIQAMTDGLHALLRETFASPSVQLYRERAFIYDWVSNSWTHQVKNELRAAFIPTSAIIDWTNEYRVIAQANMLIDHLDGATLTEGRYHYYLGQAHVVRGIMTLYIAQMWGQGPSPLDRSNDGQPCVTGEELARIAADDFRKGTELLPPASALRDNNGNTVTCKQYASRGTAWAFLAEAYAWLAGVYGHSELLAPGIAAADSVFLSGEYTLCPTIEELTETGLHRDSPESVFEIAFTNLPNEELLADYCMPFVAQKYPVERNASPMTPRPYVRLSNEKAFRLFPDPADDRRSLWFEDLDGMAQLDPSVNQGAAYIKKIRHPLYYESGFEAGEVRAYDNNIIVIRLGGLYLLQAEMCLKAGDRDRAIAALNTVRGRAGAALYSPSEDLAHAIALEVEKELFLEWNPTLYLSKVRNGTTNELPGNFATLTPADIADGALFLPIGRGYFEDNTLARQNIYWSRNGF